MDLLFKTLNSKPSASMSRETCLAAETKSPSNTNNNCHINHCLRSPWPWLTLRLAGETIPSSDTLNCAVSCFKLSHLIADLPGCELTLRRKHQHPTRVKRLTCSSTRQIEGIIWARSVWFVNCILIELHELHVSWRDLSHLILAPRVWCCGTGIRLYIAWAVLICLSPVMAPSLKAYL